MEAASISAHWSAVLFYTSIPALLLIVGGLLAFYKTPGEKLSSALQHFAAGIVIAAVAVELIPVIIKNEVRWVVLAGFAAGVAVMLCTESLGNKNKSPTTLITFVGIDVFIDGILVGVSFLANQRSGMIIALALALETLFLGISTSIKMANHATKRPTGITVMDFLALLIVLGATLGFGVVSGLSQNWHVGIISFGVAALLYLVTEELLTEAHQIPDTKMATLAFFIGFLVVLMLI